MSLHLVSVGINYSGPYKLNGCHQDVLTLKSILYDKAEKKGIYTSLTDSPNSQQPTKDSIFEAVRSTYKMLKPGDTFWFTFSGHGGQTRDASGDEEDGMDECIYDCNLNTIVDDELYKLLVDELPEKIKCRIILDCCHSGTGCDLTWAYEPYKGIKALKNDRVTTKSIICISGCRDQQTSADAWIDRKPQGALTATFSKAYSSRNGNYNASGTSKGMRWKDLGTIMHYLIKSEGYEQSPIISCSTFDLFKTEV